MKQQRTARAARQDLGAAVPAAVRPLALWAGGSSAGTAQGLRQPGRLPHSALLAVALVLFTAFTASAHDTNQLNRFSLNARIGFNITARFKDLGRFDRLPTFNPYDDGFVRRDISGNFGGETWYWGYDNDRQVSGDTILMSRSTPLGGGSSPFGVDKEDAQLGAELAYNRELFRHGAQRYGLELAANYMNIGFDDEGSFRAATRKTTDAYPFHEGTTPPLAPYEGTFGGPGFVLGDTPVSSTTRRVAGGATVTGKREFDANVWGFRLGPYADFPMGTNWNFSLSAGLAVGLVVASAKWNERIFINDRLAARSRGEGDDFGVLWGGYVSGKFSYRLSDNWRVEGGAQFQALGKYDERIDGRRVEVDLGKAIFVTAGLSYSF